MCGVHELGQSSLLKSGFLKWNWYLFCGRCIARKHAKPNVINPHQSPHYTKLYGFRQRRDFSGKLFVLICECHQCVWREYHIRLSTITTFNFIWIQLYDFISSKGTLHNSLPIVRVVHHEMGPWHVISTTESLIGMTVNLICNQDDVYK